MALKQEDSLKIIWFLYALFCFHIPIVPDLISDSALAVMFLQKKFYLNVLLCH